MKLSHVILSLFVYCLSPLSAQAPQAQDPQQVRDRWDKIFRDGAQQLRDKPSPLLTDVIRDRKPDAALDLGTGQGRNALYLAEMGWKVTGVDLSPVAIEQARQSAAARRLKLKTVVGDLDTYDFGEKRWDLITSFFMHAWHRRTKTDVPARIYRALRPGGLVVIEGFADPPSPIGLRVDELRSTFGQFRILRCEAVKDSADWNQGKESDLVRFVAQKPE